MRILKVNETSLIEATHHQAATALRELGDQIQIIVCKGKDESSQSFELNQSESNLNDPKVSRFNEDVSISSNCIFFLLRQKENEILIT